MNEVHSSLSFTLIKSVTYFTFDTDLFSFSGLAVGALVAGSELFLFLVKLFGEKTLN